MTFIVVQIYCQCCYVAAVVVDINVNFKIHFIGLNSDIDFIEATEIVNDNFY